MVSRIMAVAHRIERYNEIKEKAESIKDWNDLIHDLNGLVSDHGPDMNSQLRDSIQNFMNYTEPPQTDLTSDIDSAKSSIEQATDVYKETSQKHLHNPVSKSTLILTSITLALVAASAMAFYLTQYAVSSLTIVNVNCMPLKFENANQPLKLVKIPDSPISRGGYARALIPAGSLTLDSTAGDKLRIGYIFGQSLYIDMPTNVSDISLNTSQSFLGSQLNLDVPKGGSNSITITCSSL